MDPPVFITTTVKLKEFKINAEDDELPPTSGIKNAGMVKKNVSKTSNAVSNHRCNSRGYHIIFERIKIKFHILRC